MLLVKVLTSLPLTVDYTSIKYIIRESEVHSYSYIIYVEHLIFMANDFYQGATEGGKRIYIAYVDGEIQDVTKNRLLA